MSGSCSKGIYKRAVLICVACDQVEHPNEQMSGSEYHAGIVHGFLESPTEACAQQITDGMIMTKIST
ncbi:hypothetical protein HAX54_014595, partial [Datura stramonium]|nr:hypothetical protein [Datura stramonium]